MEGKWRDWIGSLSCAPVVKQMSKHYSDYRALESVWHIRHPYDKSWDVSKRRHSTCWICADRTENRLVAFRMSESFQLMDGSLQVISHKSCRERLRRIQNYAPHVLPPETFPYLENQVTLRFVTIYQVLRVGHAHEVLLEFILKNREHE